MTTEPVEPSPADAPPPAVPAVPAAPPAGPAVPAEPGAAPAVDLFAFPPVGAPLPVPVPVRRPRRPRPVLLLVSGLVLGAVVGGAAGYVVQAGRPETPLPPIQVALPSYPAAVVDPAAAAAAAPKPLAIDGDLRKLLMTAPAGSTAWGDYPDTPSWLTLGEFSERVGRSGDVFKRLNTQEFRRAVEVDWKKDGLKVRVTLFQFSADRAAEAKARADSYGLKPFADDANGGYEVDSTPDYWAETTEQYYAGTAVAQRGTVVMKVEVFGTQPVDPEVVKGMAKQQWERLV
ncbi:hypothetical protein [Kitasatospora sp. NPDC047058]|uniref:hypothetical protein n=1 Tax=Kitasatospora sp. NPDC047058 TaxID=3155620 RepID=UPI0033F4C707